jgi:hypothetical protein
MLDGARRVPTRLSERRRARVAVLVSTFVLLSATLAAAAYVQTGRIFIEVNTQVKPSALPVNSFTPISVGGRARFGTTDGSPQPGLSFVQLDIDRDVRLFNLGLARCNPANIEGTTTDEARRRCARAMVGQGQATAVIRPTDSSPPVQVASAVTAFNGLMAGGVPTLLIHARLGYPEPATYVVPVSVNRLSRGAFGFRLTSSPPPIAGGRGALTTFSIRLERRYRAAGRQLSLVTGRCHKGYFAYRGSATFDDGTVVAGPLFSSCKMRRRGGRGG